MSTLSGDEAEVVQEETGKISKKEYFMQIHILENSPPEGIFRTFLNPGGPAPRHGSDGPRHYKWRHTC